MKASVIIPTYNRSRAVMEAIYSVIGQDYSPLEIIVVDDGSTDDTKEVLQPLIESGQVRLIEEPHKGRPSPARNTGLQLATGDVLFLLDSDDIMLPGKLRSTIEAFNLSSSFNPGFCCTDFYLKTEDGGKRRHFSRSYYKVFQEARRTWLSDKVYVLDKQESYRSLLAGNFVGTSSVALPKSIVDAGFRFDEALTNSDDYDMWLRIARHHNLLVVDIPLHEYTVSSSGVLKNNIRTGEKWRTNIRILNRELKDSPDPDCKRSARIRLAENYRALFQCALLNKRWSEAAISMLGAMSTDFSGSFFWLLKKARRKILELSKSLQ